MRSTLSVLLITLLAGFASCEKSIKVDVPEAAPKLVMNAVVRVGEPITLDLSRTKSIRESNQHLPALVEHATAILYVNGQIADTLQGYSNGDVSTFISKVIAETGKTYRLTVSAQGFNSIEATAGAPEVVPVIAWDFKPNARQSNGNSGGGTQDALSISFRDPANTRDFYVGFITQAYETGVETDFYSWRSCVYTSDPSVESNTSDDPFGDEGCISSNSLFFQDEQFNGTEKKLTLYMSSGTLYPVQDSAGNTHYAHAYLYHVSGEFYKYLRSYRQAQNVSGNPFAEPANVSSNVQGGYGIFAILNADIVELDF